nr:chorismate mutase [uncultured Sphingorhabdus sp.]
MHSPILPPEPENCTSMPEVRAGVDALDARLVDMLARRFAYMDAAARIKTDRNAVRDEARKQQVLDNAQAAAKAAGIPVPPIAEIWELLVEASIAYELEKWDESRSASR